MIASAKDRDRELAPSYHTETLLDEEFTVEVEANTSTITHDYGFVIISRDEEIELQKMITQLREETRLAIIDIRRQPEIHKQLTEENSTRLLKALMEIPTNSYEEFWSYCRKGTREISEIVEILQSLEVKNDTTEILTSCFVEYCKAKQDLFNANGKWALHLANNLIRKVGGFRRYSEGGMHPNKIEEIRETAFLALTEAIEEIDSEQEIRLTTYSYKSIVGNVKMALGDGLHEHYIPNNVRIALSSVKDVMQIAANNGEDLSIAEANKIADTNISDDSLENAFKATRSISIESGNKDGNSPGATISAGISAGNDNAIEQSSNRDFVDFLVGKLNTLDNYERAILLGKYGIHVEGVPSDIEYGMSVENMAKLLGISFQALYKREKRMLSSMKETAKNLLDDESDNDVNES